LKCPNCGAELVDRSTSGYVCRYCGSSFMEEELARAGRSEETQPGSSPEVVVREVHHHYHEKPDRLPFALGCLFFMFFPAGVIYFLVNREDYPRRALAALLVSLLPAALILLQVLFN
jgi:hypothetical protein